VRVDVAIVLYSGGVAKAGSTENIVVFAFKHLNSTVTVALYIGLYITVIVQVRI
jgi:hypothetical protein